MTERPTRTKPAAAAKVMVAGASISSVLLMTAAMGSAETYEPIESPLVGNGETGVSTSNSTVVDPSWVMPVESDPLILPTPSAPIVGQVVDTPSPTFPAAPAVPAASVPVAPTTATPAPAPVPVAPVAAPTPIIVNVPAPAPAPSASTSKSK